MSQQSSQTKSAELTIEALDRVSGGLPITNGFAQGASGAASGKAAAVAEATALGQELAAIVQKYIPK